MSIVVCPLYHLPGRIRRHTPDRVISVLDPDATFPELGPAYADRHLRLAFHDIHVASPGATLVSTEHIDQLLAFLNQWGAGESLLIHCRAGISRSTATAFIAACYRNPLVPELRIARELRRVAPLARPNETLIAIADGAMKRDGRMVAAVADTGRGLPWIEVSEGEPFSFASQYEVSIGDAIIT